ncbi:MAG: ATP-binding protein [Bacteroidetes bacterium]|nr:ATP-binding protein [Bacteroidota bacterium]
MIFQEAEMVSVIGRRRVGKTFLIRSVYKDAICLEIEGIQNAPRKKQLKDFTARLNRAAKPAKKIKTPTNWLDAFYLLIDYMESLEETSKKVVFFDELPWLATHKSGFLRALGMFWNSWASRHNVVVVICGSAASWMIQKVVNHKGGLHNRITKRLHLKPFPLAETKHYLHSRGIIIDPYQIVQIYMAMGGVPHYLKEINAGKSAKQNIQDICFSETGLLQDEFLRLYPALFDNAENHIAIIRALFEKKQGMTRDEVIKKAKLPSGGRVSKILNELKYSGFIETYHAFNKKKKDQLFRLTDEYSLFYLQFIEDKIREGTDTWQQLSQTKSYKSWNGYAYENVCLKHIPQIKKALGISGVYSISSSFLKKGTSTEKGTQIDLLIDRNDHVINLFEIKFYNTTVSLDKNLADGLREKLRIFQESTKTNKQIIWGLITTFGLNPNQHSIGLIQHVIGFGELFEDSKT